VEVEILELAVRVILGTFTVLEMLVSTNGATAATISWCALALISSAGDEVGRQLPHVAAARAIEAVGVVFDRVFLPAAVDALLARVGPRERRLDAVRRVVGEGEADGAGGRDRQQVELRALDVELISLFEKATWRQSWSPRDRGRR
jgi:hypothetical protein